MISPVTADGRAAWSMRRQSGGIHFRFIYYYLQIIIGRAVVQSYKLVIAEGAYPSFNRYFVVCSVAKQNLLDLSLFGS